MGGGGHISDITADFPAHKETFDYASSAHQQVELELLTFHWKRSNVQRIWTFSSECSC